MKITYSAKFEETSLAGKTVRNTAIAKADNTDNVKANANVSVKNPEATATPTPTPTATVTATPTGKTADAAKTGDTRPFKAVAAIIAVALVGLAGGRYLNRKKKNDKNVIK